MERHHLGGPLRVRIAEGAQRTVRIFAQGRKAIMSASDLRGVLEAARAAAAHSTDLGNRFERLCAAALVAHPGPNGTGRFSRVWLWDEWPGSDGPDTGIDLVAEQTEHTGGGLVAIQCKFYTGQVSTQDVDSFLAASGRPEFRRRIIMHTGVGIQKNGANKIRNAHPQCEIFDTAEIGSWGVNWWSVAKEHHVVAQGTPQTRMRAKGLRGVVEGFGSLARRYRTSWSRRWSGSKWPLRTWLLIEAAIVIAATLTLAAAAVGFFVIGTLASLFLGGRKRHR